MVSDAFDVAIHYDFMNEVHAKMLQSIPNHPTFHALLAAAQELILEKGCRNTTLQDILTRTGLSKGAIYHYVKSKDELFALILQSGIEQTNARFSEQVEKASYGDLKNPLAAIVNGMFSKNDAERDVTDQIFIYLLSHKDKPGIAELLASVFRFSLETSVRWIEIGQRGGAIPSELDAQQTAVFLAMLTYGFRVMKSIPDATELRPDDLFTLMFKVLSK